MRKRATRKGVSKAGRKTASTSSANKNDEAMVETTEIVTQETQPSQEADETAESNPAVEVKNEEEAKENQEDEKEEAKPDSETHQEKDGNASQTDETKSASSSKPKPRRGKRDRSTKNRKDGAIVDTKNTATQETQPSQEADETVETKPAVEGENEEEAKENQEEEKEEAKPVSETHQGSQNDEAKGASSSQPERRRGKRKRAAKNEKEKEKDNIPSPRAKRERTTTTKPKEAVPEYFKEKRSLEDLWKAAFPVGTEWDQLDALYEFNWDFINLEEALEEGGRLYGKRVYVFGCTESHLLPYKNENKAVLVPAVVCIESSIPPSDKIGVASVQGEVEKIIPMKDMKMAWVPYAPLEERDRQVERMNSHISILSCTQRRSALKHLKEDRVKKFNYCLPYIDNPFKEDESEQSTVVQITFPSEPPVVCEYDWAKNDIEEFTDNLITEEALVPGQKDEFMEFVMEQSDKAETANEEAKQAREKTKEGMSEETKNAYKEMKLYKFYPLPSPDTPDTAGIEKSPFINRYFGKAHEVL